MRFLRSPRHLPLGLIGGLIAVFLLTGAFGYVYSYDPARDTLDVELASAQVADTGYLSGTIVAVDDASLRFVDASGVEHSVPLAAGVEVEALERLASAPLTGATVNIGVNDSRFGQFVTGIVVIEAAP